MVRVIRWAWFACLAFGALYMLWVVVQLGALITRDQFRW